MVPHAAARGHSFKGAGQYYLHDRKASTDKRVEFAETRNLPTTDPEKGLKWMSYTAMHAEEIKHAAGGDRRGGKAKSGAVYSFSLAWHPDQEPDREEMTSAADSFMAKLGLEEHQAVLVAHNDANHDHIHGIVNLVHPETGKRAKMSLDRLKMSKWAQEYEEKQGEILCQNRVKNNAERERLKQEKLRSEEGLKQEFNKANGQKKKKRSGFVKGREEQLEKAPTISELYECSDSGKAFRAALKEQGYTLAKGDRRGFVILDEQGKVSSLSRQLKGQRAKDIKARLEDIRKDLRTAEEELQNNTEAIQEKFNKTVEQDNQKQQSKGENEVNQLADEYLPIYDRDAEEVERQKALMDGAERHAKKLSRDNKKSDQGRGEKGSQSNKPDTRKKKPPHDVRQDRDKPQKKTEPKLYDLTDALSKHLDRTTAEITAEQDKLNQHYKFDEMNARISELEAATEGRVSLRDKLSGKHKKQVEALRDARKQLDNAQARMAERMDAMEKRHAAEREVVMNKMANDNAPQPQPSPEGLQQAKDEINAMMREGKKRQPPSPDRALER